MQAWYGPRGIKISTRILSVAFSHLARGNPSLFQLAELLSEAVDGAGQGVEVFPQDADESLRVLMSWRKLRAMKPTSWTFGRARPRDPWLALRDLVNPPVDEGDDFGVGHAVAY